MENLWELVIAGGSLLVAILGIHATHHTARRQDKKKALGYRVVSDSPLVAPEAGTMELTILHGERRLRDPRLIVVRLANPGRVEVQTQDFQEDLHITLLGVSTIIVVNRVPEVTGTPKEESKITYDQNELRIPPFLLNPGDTVELQVLAEGSFTGVRVTGHIAGVSRITPLSDDDGTSTNRLRARFAALALPVALLVATLASGVWFAKVLIVGDPPPKSAGAQTQTFSVQIGDRIGENLPAPGAGTLEKSGSVDLYTFTGVKDQRIFLERRDCANQFTIEMELQRANGEPLPNAPESFYNCTLDPDPVLLPETGDYTLRVKAGYTSGPGTYEVKIWESPSILYRVDIRSVIEGQMTAPRSENVYEFDAARGQTVGFIAAADAGLQITWALLDPEGRALSEGRTYGDGQAQIGPVTLSNAGEHRLVVTGLGTGRYTIAPGLR